MQSELGAQISILKILIKEVETRIKEVQQETRDSLILFSKSQVWVSYLSFSLLSVETKLAKAV